MQHARTAGPFASEPAARGKHELLKANDTADIRGTKTILLGSPAQTAVTKCVQG
jgi:hypothetical protein